MRNRPVDSRRLLRVPLTRTLARTAVAATTVAWTAHASVWLRERGADGSAGHAVLLEQPAAFNDALRSFARSVE